MEEMSSQLSTDERTGLTPSDVSRKRKDRDRHRAHMTTTAAPADSAEPAAPAHLPLRPQPAAAGGNRLLAGYLAYEFLTRGTLFGERWDSSASRPPAPEAEEGKPPSAYAEVAHLLKTDGAHVAGIVNPTQLAQWLHM